MARWSGHFLAACAGRTRCSLGCSFPSTDPIADSSRKLACRRAGVSVVSPVLSIRRDRRSASDLSIARHSRSSISSFKCPRPSARRLAYRKSGTRYRAQRPVRACQSSAFFRPFCVGHPTRHLTRCQALCRRRKRLLLAGHRRRTSSPASESMVEGGRSLVAQQPSDLGKGHAGLLEILERQTAPQLIYDLLVGRSLDSEPARERSRAHAERFGDGFAFAPCRAAGVFPPLSRPRRATYPTRSCAPSPPCRKRAQAP